jgi:NOL1/NOP2/sun family putative RNA methylase
MLPTGFTERMEQLLGDEAQVLLSALSQPAVTGLRVNTLKLTAEIFARLSGWSLDPVPWSTHGFVVNETIVRPGAHPYHPAGLYYLQEPSAMSVAEALSPQPGELVIDLAAAPGGKTTHLAALMQNQGVLIANDVNASRAQAILENIERLGLTNTVVISSEVAALAARWQGIFDKVLLDAPCSGEGMFRKSEDAKAMWSVANITQCALRQQHLITEAAQLVKPGGHLIYSTCTFAPEENEQVIGGFLADHPDFQLEPLTLSGVQPGFTLPDQPFDTSQTARIWPHLATGEGHFIARLKRATGKRANITAETFPPLTAAVRKQWRELATQLRYEAEGELTQFGKQLFAVPEGVPNLKGLRVLRSGLWLATAHKNRVEPSHSLALATVPSQISQMNHLTLTLDDPRLEHYLQGGVLEEPGEAGFILITVQGYPLGWGKRAHGVINNLYPKGLRRN